MKYFPNYWEARNYIKNNNLNVKPKKVRVWVYPAWEEIWSVMLPNTITRKLK